MNRKPRKKKCKQCKDWFQPHRIGQSVCSPECALHWGRVMQQKKANVAHRVRKAALKTPREHLKEAQTVFNKYIRLRDAHLPCISCQRFHGGQIHAGHYLTTAAFPELRFTELNCHAQCAPCNNHLSGNIQKYRINLINKIGEQAVIDLEGPHEPLKLTIDDIKEIKRVYKSKIKALKESKAVDSTGMTTSF